MGDDGHAHNVAYVVWEFCRDKRGRLGFHQKLVSYWSDSEAFLRLVCVRCKHLRVCPNCDYTACVFFGRALRNKPCGNFAPILIRTLANRVMRIE